MNSFNGKLCKRGWILSLFVRCGTGMWSCYARRHLHPWMSSDRGSSLIRFNSVAGENRVCIIWAKCLQRMVRRWSYINSLNSHNASTVRAVQKASLDANMNTLMYLKKRYSLPTKITRKQWARRKHLHNWITHLNVLKDWAKSYRLYRNHNKVIYYQFFTKNTFLVFNLVAARNSIPARNKGSEDLVAGTYTRRILNRFAGYCNPRLKFLGRFASSHVLPTSAYAPNPTLTSSINFFENNTAVTPLLTDHLDFTSHWETSSSDLEVSTSSLRNLLGVYNTLVSSQLLSTYKLLVLLTFVRCCK